MIPNPEGREWMGGIGEGREGEGKEWLRGIGEEREGKGRERKGMDEGKREG